jgi:hypothetical protein
MVRLKGVSHTPMNHHSFLHATVASHDLRKVGLVVIQDMKAVQVRWRCMAGCKKSLKYIVEMATAEQEHFQ